MVEWRPLLVGTFFAIAIFAVGYLSSQSIALLAVLLGGVVTGYMVVELKAGAIHGTILGLIIGVIVALFQIVLYVMMGFGAMITAAFSAIIVLLILDIIVGAIGGVIGSLIKNESLLEAEGS